MLEERLNDSGGTSKDQNVNRVADSEHWIHEVSYRIEDYYNLEKRQFMLNTGEKRPASYLCHKTWLRLPLKWMSYIIWEKES